MPFYLLRSGTSTPVDPLPGGISSGRSESARSEAEGGIDRSAEMLLMLRLLLLLMDGPVDALEFLLGAVLVEPEGVLGGREARALVGRLDRGWQPARRASGQPTGVAVRWWCGGGGGLAGWLGVLRCTVGSHAG